MTYRRETMARTSVVRTLNTQKIVSLIRSGPARWHGCDCAYHGGIFVAMQHNGRRVFALKNSSEISRDIVPSSPCQGWT
ncbi:hypothetical protein CUJ84_Chr003376 [Rhizobium leguminosarum]|uniref:Uncharacterized protein n=1 Tax=Rhizobium leguminosarum TaxID=384 RepID=A0A2K9Z655_RHILE|nr:hypothetical protein CUJ84_Chr003376 [Rhizobium leguminosarum]